MNRNSYTSFPTSHEPRFYAAPNFLKMGIKYLKCRILDNFDNTGRNVCCKVPLYNKSSALAEMGDRGHNRHGPKRGGLLCLFRGQLGPRLAQCGLGRGLVPYQGVFIHPAVWHNKHGPKMGGVAVPSFLGVAGSSSITKSPGPRPISIPSAILVHPVVWPQGTSAENRETMPLQGRGTGSPSNTMSPRPRPTSVPNSILIHAAVWPQ